MYNTKLLSHLKNNLEVNPQTISHKFFHQLIQHKFPIKQQLLPIQILSKTLDMPILQQKYQTNNSYDYQSQPAITDFSPRAGNRRNTQNKIQQVRDKINDVISMANQDKREGKTEFEGVVQGQRGILDLLKQGADTDPALSHLYLPSGQGKFSRYVGPGGQGGQGVNYPNDGGYGNTRSTYNIESSQHPVGPAGPTGYSRQGGLGDYGGNIGQNAANSRLQNDFQNIPMSQQARQQLADIQVRATQYLQELKKVRSSLVQQLNEEIKLHNRDKERRMWLEQQLARIINQLRQQGKIPPNINFPQWYQQTDNKLIPLYTHQSGNVQWNQPISQDYSPNQPFQQGPFRSEQYNQQGEWGRQPGMGQTATFSPQRPVYNNYQNQYYQNQQGGQGPRGFVNYDGFYHQNQPQQNSQYYQQSNQFQQPIPSYQQIPSQQFQQQRYQQPPYEQSYQQYQPRSPTYHQDYQNMPSPGPKYYDNRQTTDIYAQVPRIPHNQQQQQGMRNRMQDLRRQNQYIRNLGEGGDASNLKQKLDAAERMANDYAREMDRWRMEGKKGANYPGLLQLLDEGQKIRQQTLKLLKMKR